MNKKLSSVQSFRSFAAIMIVLHHCVRKGDYYFDTYYWKYTTIGNSGVDIYFILSGLVIYLSTYDKFDPVLFLKKRLIRIVPLFWLLTAVFVFLLCVFPDSFDTHVYEKYWVLKSFLFIPQEKLPVLYVSWMLVYILYFYVIFALFRSFLGHYSYYALSVFFIASFCTGIINHLGTPIYALVTSNLLIEFLLGMVIARMYVRRLRFDYKVTFLLILLGLLSLYYLNSYKLRMITYGFPWFLVLSGFILSSHSIKWPKYIIKLGDASYSIFLIQAFTVPIIANIYMFFIPEFYPNQPVFLVTVCFCVTLLCGLFVYTCVEQPLTRIFYKVVPPL